MFGALPQLSATLLWSISLAAATEVTCPGRLLALDQRSGDDFTLTEQTGSPQITAIDLPVLDGVASYFIRSLSGNTWSSFQSGSPGVEFTFDPVSAVEIVPVDSGGNPVMVTDLVFGLYFASNGSFTGSVTQGTNAPAVPPMLTVTQVGGLVTLSWNTNNASGFVLQRTASLGDGSSWVDVTYTPTIAGNQFSLTFPSGSGWQFFRLKQ